MASLGWPVVVSTFPVSSWSFLGGRPVSSLPPSLKVLTLWPGLLAWAGTTALSHPQLCICFSWEDGKEPA